jgi:repressor of nif and glnA expression
LKIKIIIQKILDKKNHPLSSCFIHHKINRKGKVYGKQSARTDLDPKIVNRKEFIAVWWKRSFVGEDGLLTLSKSLCPPAYST